MFHIEIANQYCYPTIDDCQTGAVLIHGRWYHRSEIEFPENGCGCGCGEWVESCFFCRKPTLSFEAVFASKGGTKFRYSCKNCAVGREVSETLPFNIELERFLKKI